MTGIEILILSGGFHVLLLFAHGTYIALSAGLAWGTGRRDTPVARSDLGRRFERTVTNNVESMVAFVPIMAASLLVEAHNPLTLTAALIYLLARMAFAAVYLANVPYVRTAVWFCAQLAIGTIAVVTFLSVMPQ